MTQYAGMRSCPRCKSRLWVAVGTPWPDVCLSCGTPFYTRRMSTAKRDGPDWIEHADGSQTSLYDSGSAPRR